MIKQDLVSQVAESTGRTEYETKILIEATLAAIHNALCNGDQVILRGFGSFSVKERAPKLVSNLNTGERYMIGKRKAVVFKSGMELND